MLKHNLTELVENSQNILLLQGPIGSFFQDFSHWLVSQQKTLFKINFNQGDEYFYPLSNEPYNPYCYRGELEQFKHFLQEFLYQHKIDTLICFGDNRPYHKIAKILAEQNQLNFWVFEEGYFRPHYVTLEKYGVNDFSKIPRKAEFFLQQMDQFTPVSEPEPLAPGFFPVASLATRYYTQSYWNTQKYPNYFHHRILNINYYIKLWLISGYKKAYHYLPEKIFAHHVEKGRLGEFFIVPLQVYDDSQVKVHSNFNSVRDFLVHVLDSFVQYAPEHLNLIVKHHPMDRGFISYKATIKDYIKRYPQLKKRLHYIYDMPLPVLLRKGKGMITLNSTSGLSALLHNMPVITLGRANYNFQGLTHQGELTDFWHNPTPPNPEVFQAYRQYHLCKTQINGSFYNKVILDKVSN
ncbi:capsular polysaccharide export protein [Volucribacter psittacicida]|uniref:Capsular polysaccharide export protein n=1 Tax=Volucribacter psittacicida TaxID=203482 RepID=A0A4R1FVN4_9PAST|nr:capsule biosynthesis protein [Volucribacter psittacicida]TCJ97902.1 capsular polysaccharide export protein [Volucribacter psittacicida]